ncbi:lytic transglycosylase domain-containing protein (plasmid) [Agrobacterium leguminum]|uniref:lytic transglycosylase domain-containing protein n=1 Tax=Agrobacterium leguminum TaxID=2792015 RepID=UPI001E42400C|nr:lytic transglycosylase domain-containing protein [Agrobacterium leguminum]WFS69579.1 lytic transglycosylase domain-containing protein [Agrobacterium leguminum]
MDRSSLVHVTLSKIACSRRVKLAAATTAFVMTSFAAVSNVGDAAHDSRVKAVRPKPVTAASYGPIKVSVSRSEPAEKATGMVATTPTTSIPPLDLASFNGDRFGERMDRPDNAFVGTGEGVSSLNGAESVVVAYALDEPLGTGRREQAVRSSIEVFSYGVMGEEAAEPAGEDRAGVVAGAGREPRPDLLAGVPPEYAGLVTKISAEEGVDPNLMLSIMRVENADFDPTSVSPAGAIGLMQVMPKVGEAFGAADLADPEQNVRAGARFLRVLVDKYRNPVLIASAYNAGEPKVDVRRSVPLIEETADYVTRVVGLYTNTSTTDEVFQIGRSAGVVPAAKRSGARSGRADRAKSPMLVFSVGSTVDVSGRVEQESGQAHVSGPLKIKKEEVIQ